MSTTTIQKSCTPNLHSFPLPAVRLRASGPLASYVGKVLFAGQENDSLILSTHHPVGQFRGLIEVHSLTPSTITLNFLPS